MTAVAASRILAFRRFNRFFTRRIGLLRKTFLDTPWSLGEMRVLWEIAHGDSPTASDVAAVLDLDAGYLSRVLQSFEKKGLVSRTPSSNDARQSHLKLTAKGRTAFGEADQRQVSVVRDMLGRLKTTDQARLAAAMATIETLLDETPPEEKPKRSYIMRDPQIGDFGWIVTRHAKFYAEEYGWVEPFEGLCAQIVADFVNTFDPKLEKCWIAEVDGEPAGCIMLVKDAAKGTARIRLLLVEPSARGMGLGRRLVEECIQFARTKRYQRVTLWTHSILTAARAIYARAGFTLTASEPHNSWGKEVVSETWDLVL